MKSHEIKQLREQLKLTQAQLARRLGVGRVTVARWETGRQEPSSLALAQIKQLQKEIGHEID